MKYTFIRDHRGSFPVSLMCQTLEGWLYLAITLDLFHRKIIGWAMDRWISRQLAIDALKMAFKNGCIEGRR